MSEDDRPLTKYETDPAGYAKAREVLRGGAKKVSSCVYRYKGQLYRIVEGRCLDPTEWDAFDEEARKRG
jgi:hypothetical protein